MQMLMKERKVRLGSRTDFAEIRDHPFFAPIDWAKLNARAIPVRKTPEEFLFLKFCQAPYVPNVQSDKETNMIASEFVSEPYNPRTRCIFLASKLLILVESLVPTHQLKLANGKDKDFDGFTYVDAGVLKTASKRA